MPNFQLFAARDGDVLSTRACHLNKHDARDWATQRIVEHFRLTPKSLDFEEAISECDGVLLEQISDATA